MTTALFRLAQTGRKGASFAFCFFFACSMQLLWWLFHIVLRVFLVPVGG